VGLRQAEEVIGLATAERAAKRPSHGVWGDTKGATNRGRLLGARQGHGGRGDGVRDGRRRWKVAASLRLRLRLGRPLRLVLPK